MSMLTTKLKQFTSSLQRGTVTGSFNTAVQTLEILREFIAAGKWASAEELINVIKTDCKIVTDAKPLELAVGNMVRRILHIIREEYYEYSDEEAREQEDAPNAEQKFSAVKRASSMIDILERDSKRQSFSNTYTNLKTRILEGVNAEKADLDDVYVQIADQALEHIHSNEVILTFGKSRTVTEFLKAAGRKRKFEVLVAESVPSYYGHELALELSESNIQTTLVTDSAVFALMARVNKVIVGTHAVMANGGLIAHPGTHMLAQAAKHHSIPFVVCTGLYKLSPEFPQSYTKLGTFSELNNPNEIMDFTEGEAVAEVRVCNPAWDYVPPELVSLYLTNSGGHSPTYIYRLLAEVYSPEDL